MLHDKETGWVEAEVTINGKSLTFAESLTLRVAVSTFLMQVSEPETVKLLGAIAHGYRERLLSIQDKLHEP